MQADDASAQQVFTTDLLRAFSRLLILPFIHEYSLVECTKRGVGEFSEIHTSHPPVHLQPNRDFKQNPSFVIQSPSKFINFIAKFNLI